jgi:DNA-binding winged helix-turn-helix (wHTH) protein/tetratricopeptide (TPR) repeat protein
MAELGEGRPDRIEFGIFSVDLRAGELRKQGTRLKLQDRPFQILAMLLEQAGEVVTREQIRARLWPDGTFVDFDHSIHSAINKLRETLGDSAAAPRYVETMGRRGYRFIYPVTRPVAAAPLNGFHNGLTVPISDPAPTQSSSLTPPSSTQQGKPKSRRRLALALALSGAAIAGTAFMTPRHVSGFRGVQTLVVTDIENLTGDSAFDGTLKHAAIAKLNESPFFAVVPEAASNPSKDSVEANCQSAEGRAIVRGSIETVPSGEFRLRIAAHQCGEKAGRAEETVIASEKNGVLPALGDALDALRRDLGEPDETPKRFRTPLVQATTSSVAALKTFAMAEEQRAKGRDLDIAPLYVMATDMDPNFAVAYARLGIIYSNAEEYGTSLRYFQKAFDLREHATERERLYIMAHYYAARGEFEKQRHVYELWRQLYPRDLVPANNLVALYLGLGELEKGVQSAQDAVRLGPDNAFPYTNLMQAYQETGRFSEANALYDDAAGRKMDNVVFHQARYLTAFAQDDEAEMQRQLKWAEGKPQAGEILNEAAMAAMARGQVRLARTLVQQADAVGVKNGLKQFASAVRVQQAQLEADLGFTEEPRGALRRASQLAPKAWDLPTRTALVLARTGDSRAAAALLSRSSQADESNGAIRQILIPIARGATELQRGDAASALTELSQVEPYDLSLVTGYCSIYYRGLAHLQLRHSAEAASQFEKIIKYRAVRPSSIYIVLAHLGLARAYVQSGKIAEANKEYETFFELWKNADASIPILRAAKTEFSRTRVTLAAYSQAR